MVSAQHPGRLRRSVTAVQVEHSWNFLCGRASSPWITAVNQPAPQPSTVAWEKQPATSTADIINNNLSDFWTSFNPDLDLPTPDDIFPDDNVGLDELRHGGRTIGTTQKSSLTTQLPKTHRTTTMTQLHTPLTTERPR